jgi:uncharacterized repeat protein (TIGR03803 family)
MAGLINFGGMLYGTTKQGGSQNSTCSQGCGTIFSVNPKTGGTETVVYAFQGPTVINQTTDFGDGDTPMAGLLNVNGTLYGTTYGGGDNTTTSCTHGCGTIFSFIPKTHTETVLYTFEGFDNGDGANPVAGLIKIYVAGTGSVLYGTTEDGGANDFGTVFSFDPVNGEVDLYDFAGNGDGAYPMAGLLYANITGIGALMYGTTYSGGTGDNGIGDTGTVFSIDTSGNETVVYSFCTLAACSDGANPLGGLIKTGFGAKTTLYGTTEFGGPSHGDGTVFSINPTTVVETVLYSFCQTGGCSDGDEPTAGLVSGGGALYGTTLYGGTSGEGTVFSVKP